VPPPAGEPKALKKLRLTEAAGECNDAVVTINIQQRLTVPGCCNNYD
jgi:hypothetical protein